MMRIRRRRGQSTIEYLVILSAIIAVIITIASTILKPQVISVSNRALRRMKSSEVFTDTMLPALP